MPSWMSLGFQDLCSPFMYELSYLHDHVMVVMVSVIIMISYVMLCLILNTSFYKFLSEGTYIETIWSIVPAFLLVLLVIPSMHSLYYLESFNWYHYTVKIIAHQWYWTYMVPFLKNMYLSINGEKFCFHEYDSIMEIHTLDSDFPRLMGCSEDLYLPEGASTRLLITSTDVIHSFAVPSMGLKVDAMPGRINQLNILPSRAGSFYGQCSEICGSNHSFMPISVKVTTYWDYQDVLMSYVYDYLMDYDPSFN